MSDRDEMASDPGYDTPVPELDDHRHHSRSSHRPERPRRGTFDSLYGSRQPDAGQTAEGIKIRDFEEAVADDEDTGLSPPSRRHRRPTVETTGDGRAMSPPNSVKAFAQARRRERGLSFSDPNRDNDDSGSRAVSMNSRRTHRSYRSKSHTINTDNGSLLTNRTAEEDVCFPLQDNQQKNQLHIDFDYLESFVNAQREAHAVHNSDSQSEAFEDLRDQQSSRQARVQLATSDGDILDMPSDESVIQEKKTEGHKIISPAKQVVDQNRFSFFSSAWESTIHAAEMADLVLPGEDIRGLFELPEDESDGVWWLNINGAMKDEVQGICRAFGIHPLTIEDIITQEAREKIELFPCYYFACFRSFHVVDEPDGKEYEPFNIYVVVFREGTLSFSFAPNTHAAEVRTRITALKDYVSLSSDWICYALM